MIQMWPLELGDQRNAQRPYDEARVRAKVWEKPIEDIRTGDKVVSFDAQGRLIPGTVGRTFRKVVPHVLNWFGTKVTPGHVYLCGHPEQGYHHDFLPLLDILLEDGCIVRSNGQIIRASTNRPAGGPLDRLVQVKAVTLRPGDHPAKVDLTELSATETGVLRNGTLILLPNKKGKDRWVPLRELLKKEKGSSTLLFAGAKFKATFSGKSLSKSFFG